MLVVCLEVDINLGHDGEIAPNDRQLRGVTKQLVNLHKQQCEELALDILEDCDEVEMAEYSCCYCEVDMLLVQWNLCDTCKEHCHGYGIGCMNRAGVCKNCQIE